MINKADIADPVTLERLRNVYPGSVVVSAAEGDGIDALLEAVAQALQEHTVELELVIPYDRGELLALAHQFGDVVSQDHADGGTKLHVRLPRGELYRFSEWAADGAIPTDP